MTQLLGGSGRVIVGNQSFPNSWVEPGKTIRQVTCAICLDTGRTLTDDGSLGELCDCTYGEGITNQWCTALESAAQVGADPVTGEVVEAEPAEVAK